MEKERGQLELAEYDYAKAISLDEDNTDYRINRIDLLIMSTESWMPIANWKLCRRKALRLVVCKTSTADCVARNNH